MALPLRKKKNSVQHPRRGSQTLSAICYLKDDVFKGLWQFATLMVNYVSWLVCRPKWPSSPPDENEGLSVGGPCRMTEWGSCGCSFFYIFWLFYLLFRLLMAPGKRKCGAAEGSCVWRKAIEKIFKCRESVRRFIFYQITRNQIVRYYLKIAFNIELCMGMIALSFF